MPVSSSAQLVLLPWLLGWEQPADRTAFSAALHAGSCAGIAWTLRADLRALSRRELAVLAAVSAPAAVVGLLAADAVEQRLGRPPQLAALLAGAGALMWWADDRAARRPARPADPSPHPAPVLASHPRRMTTSDTPGGSGVIMSLGGAGGVTGRQAALAALAQVAALVPGVSRSGATLTALRLTGVERAAAERFTLLMSLPVTAGAAGLALLRAERQDLRATAPGLLAGAATAGLSGALAARGRVARPGRPLTGAALYRLGLAAVVAARLRSRKGTA